MRAGFLVFVPLLVACGGKIESTFEPLPSSSSTSSTSSTSSSSSSSASSSSSGAPSPGCARSALGATRACVPGIGAPEQAITIEVDEPEGCLGCGTTIDPCAVTVSGNVITLDVSATSCPTTSACPPVCGRKRTACAIPPLASGTYSVAIAGEAARALRRDLVVAPGGETSCVLPPQGAPPDSLTGYASSCNEDADCTTIVDGDICPPCACPERAMSKSAQGKYDADVRAASSHCAASAPVACGPCTPYPARCYGRIHRCTLLP